MAKLYFKYGTMNSGKSMLLLAAAHNYASQGRRILVYTTEEYRPEVVSRAGLRLDAIPLREESYSQISNSINKYGEPVSAILVDESQFMSEAQVKGLAKIVDVYNIPVLCYGLKNDFQNKLFPGSAALLAYADKLEEIKTICWNCGSKATMNLRTLNGKPVREGEQVQVGDKEYLPVCRKCYNKRLDTLEIK